MTVLCTVLEEVTVDYTILEEVIVVCTILQEGTADYTVLEEITIVCTMYEEAKGFCTKFYDDELNT